MAKKYVTANNWTVTVGGKKYPPSPSPYKPVFVEGLNAEFAEKLLAAGKIREFVMPTEEESVDAKALNDKLAAAEKSVEELTESNKALNDKLAAAEKALAEAKAKAPKS